MPAQEEFLGEESLGESIWVKMPTQEEFLGESIWVKSMQEEFLGVFE